jgi:hypothetical protein
VHLLVVFTSARSVQLYASYAQVHRRTSHRALAVGSAKYQSAYELIKPSYENLHSLARKPHTRRNGSRAQTLLRVPWHGTRVRDVPVMPCMCVKM